MKVIICGSRSLVEDEDFEDYFRAVMNRLFSKKRSVTFVVGGATGPDKMTEEWSRIGDSVEIHRPDYIKHKSNPKFAPLARNQEMVDSGATHLLAFHDGVSKGTLDIIERARKKGLKVKIILYRGEK